MKHVGKKTLLTLSCVFASLGAFSQNDAVKFVSDDIAYEGLSDKTAVVTGFADGAEGRNLNVPEYVEYDGIKYTVTAIGENSFMSSSSLASVTLPSTIKEIKDCAFDACLILKDVTLSEGLETISYDAFGSCSSMESITIPSTVKNIGDYAFMGCSALESITIPEGVKTVGTSTFQSCYMLLDVQLPQSLEKIGDFAFSDCASITSIDIPDNVNYIGHYAFYFSDMLSEVNLPANLEYVGDCAFEYTSWYDEWLEEQPEGLLYLGKVAYVYNGDAAPGTNVEIKDGTIRVAMKAFSYVGGIESIYVPASVTEIAPKAFMDCTDLREVKLPDGIKQIDRSTFENCTNLEKVTMPKELTRIVSDAFKECESLTEIILPEKMENIGCNAFAGCTSLEKIYSYNKVAPLVEKDGEGETDIFESTVYADATLFVPVGAADDYKAKEGWMNFANIVDNLDLGICNAAVNDNISISVVNGRLVVNGTDASAIIKVYDMSGRTVYNGDANNIELPNGIYMVNIGNITKKVSVM